MACCYACLLPRSSFDWSDLGANASMSIPLGFDLDLADAAGGAIVVAVHVSAVNDLDGAGAQLVGNAVVWGCDVDDRNEFFGPELFRVELGQAAAGDAIAIALPEDLPEIGRAHLEVAQGVNAAAAQTIAVSVWLRKREDAHR